MACEVVTGYCWPQSVAAGEQVGLHLSSAGGRPVSRRGRARRRRATSCSADGAVAADEPPDADGRGLARGAAGRPRSTLDVDPVVALGLLRGRPRDRRRRQGAGAATPSSSCGRPAARRRVDPARAGHQHLARVQRLRRRNLYTGGTHVVAATADGARATCSSRRARAAG